MTDQASARWTCPDCGQDLPACRDAHGVERQPDDPITARLRESDELNRLQLMNGALERDLERVTAERDEALRVHEADAVDVAEANLALAKASQAIEARRQDSKRWRAEFQKTTAAVCDALAGRDSARAELAEVRAIVRKFVKGTKVARSGALYVEGGGHLWDALYAVACAPDGQDATSSPETGGSS